MVHLEKITLNKDYRNLEAGLEIEFRKPITLFMGENGTGKSSILDMLRDHYDLPDNSYYKDKDHGKNLDIIDTGLTKDDVKYFDFHAEDAKFAGAFREDMLTQIHAQRLSSGLGLSVQLAKSGIMKAENSLILLDEPDRGMAPKVQHMYLMNLPRVAELRDNQFILSTHSTILMRMPDMDPDMCEIYSMDRKKYMTPKEFMDDHIFGE